MVQYIRGFSVHLGNIMSISGVLNALEGTMSAWGGGYQEYIGGVQYIWGYHDACGGYHEYIEGCSVHRDIMSTLGFSIEIERIYQVALPNAS